MATDFKKRGQISIEYMIVVGFVTFLVIGMLGLGLFYSGQIKDTVKLNQVQAFADKIIASSESVFYAGEPSQTTLRVFLPNNVENIDILANDLVLDVSTSSGVAKIAFSSDVTLEGSLSSSGGVRNILIVAKSDKVTLSDVS